MGSHFGESLRPVLLRSILQIIPNLVLIVLLTFTRAAVLPKPVPALVVTDLAALTDISSGLKATVQILRLDLPVAVLTSLTNIIVDGFTNIVEAVASFTTDVDGTCFGDADAQIIVADLDDVLDSLDRSFDGFA
ncbi:hypothetical protein CALCODRAFT_553493 [Calocera cornea HHB12733]|uniref:Uncharacterized protein n=1 Tax=Calocera cornea HHB12733 TaxID=1353952 RepID=A0A165IN24_9BASI|nr:hypothetical protein CALCODRAFT_553493 [Calocera cornea HHB12733]